MGCDVGDAVNTEGSPVGVDEGSNVGRSEVGWILGVILGCNVGVNVGTVDGKNVGDTVDGV